MNRSTNQRTTIVGAGSIGLCLAWELAQRGFDVTIVDRGEPGKATSWAAAGILPPANFDTATDPIDQLRGLSHKLFPAWTKRLQEITGIDPGLRRCGGWYLTNTPGERAAMIGMADYWRELDIQCERISIEEVARREPALATWIKRSPAAAAWWTPDEYQLRSPKFLSALTLACKESGVRFSSHTTVQDIQHSDDIVTVNATASDSSSIVLQSDSVVVCAGAWTGGIAAMLRLQQSLVPVRGQILLLKTRAQLLKGIVNLGHRYLVARDDGHTLVGSVEEEVGLIIETTKPVLDSLRQFALSMCPELESADEVASWAGLRPMTFDGFPILGRVPETTNVYVASGHFRSGLHLSPATATVMADLMEQKTPAVDLSPFRVGKQQNDPPKHSDV